MINVFFHSVSYCFTATIFPPSVGMPSGHLSDNQYISVTMWRRTLVYIFAVSFIDARKSKLVNTTQGPVQGYHDPENGIYVFQSIPYANVPTGIHKFKSPLPPPKWTQPLDAKDMGIICPQVQSPVVTNQTMQENCLILNVYVPDTEAEKLPTVVYIHGGGYQIGFGDMLVPKKLIAEHNIISITLNYRLGAHGFLCLGTESIPGNAGMKDIVAALRWVKNNIGNFDGDPGDVTIAGYSAGAAAVDLLMLSKSAEGLFSKVITESGGGLASWSMQSDPINNAKTHAKSIGFNDPDNLYALEDFYKTVSMDLLIQNTDTETKDFHFGFSPCVERNLGNEVFLEKSPVDILKSGEYRKIPLLYGFANMEGLMRIDLFDKWKIDMNENFAEFIPSDLKFNSDNEKFEVSMKIKEYYFGENPIEDSNILNYVDFFTDTGFAYPCLRSVKYQVEAGHDQIYLYEYSYVDENTPLVPHTNVKGANHGMQIVPIFNGIPGMVDASNFTEEMKNFSILMRRIWGNFIRTGKPLPEGSELGSWPAVGSGWAPHMSLGNEVTLQGSLLEQRVRFWDEIYSQYYRDPVPPYMSVLQHSEL